MKVDGDCLTDATRKLYEVYQNEDSVKCLGVPDILKAGVQARNLLINCVDEVPKWTVREAQLQQKQMALKEVLGKYDEAMKVVLDYHAALKDCESMVAAQTAQGKRSLRFQKEKQQGRYIDLGVPDVVATSLATFVATEGVCKGASSTPTNPCELEASDLAGNPSEPFNSYHTLGFTGGVDTSFMHKLVFDEFTGRDEEIRNMMPGLQAFIESNKRSHGCGALKASTTFFENEDLKKSLTIDVQCPPLLCMQRVKKLKVSMSAVPYLTLGHYLVGVDGVVFVILVSPDGIYDAGGDVLEWIREQPQSAVMKWPQFIILPKQGLFVPPGYYALTVGIDTRVEAELSQTRRQQTKEDPE